MKHINLHRIFTLFLFWLITSNGFSWDGMPMPELNVDGRYLKDSHGHVVNLHGFAQTYSPWFNEHNSKWNNYDVQGCLDYNQTIIDNIMDAGWKVNFVRMHMDPYWSNTPGCNGRYEGEECFNETRFIKYLDEVFVPMAEYAISKGLYVVMRPPGVAPENIEIGGVYHDYLLRVWDIVAQHPTLNSNPHIMFELANEPINILGPDGTYGAGTQGHSDNLKTYFQAIVDVIRDKAENILWIPGLGYQSLYAGYAVNPIEGDNIGYAVHVYPGWFNSGKGYEPFQRGWDNQVQPVADFAPVMVTEMDWAPEHHEKSWGKDITGEAGGVGFGANFKKITDDCGNVSWLIFTEPHFLANFDNPNASSDVVNFLTDPEACPLPVFQWYQGYAEEYELDGVSNEYLILNDLIVVDGLNISVLTNSSKGLTINAVFEDGHVENVSSICEFEIDNPDIIEIERGRIFPLKDGIASVHLTFTDPMGKSISKTLQIASSSFPLTNELFNPDIWENGTFDETINTLQTGTYGFGGWQYDGMDLSEYKYIVARLDNENIASADFRIFDNPSYWSSPATFQFDSNGELVVVLNHATKDDGSLLNLKNIYIAGFWSTGSNPFVIDTVFLSNSSEFDPPTIFVNNLDGNEINDLNSFIYERESGPSESQIILVEGTKLSSKIEITAPSGFEIALDTIDGFSSSISIMPVDSIVEATSIIIRMKQGLSVDEYTGNMSFISDGAYMYTLAISGKVVHKTGINNLRSESDIVSVHYFNLSGQSLKNIDHRSGIFIQKSTMKDGTIRTLKIAKY